MPRNQKATTPDGNTDAESDEHSPQRASTAEIAAMVENLAKFKSRRTSVRQKVENAHKERMSELKTKITKHYQTEMTKRSELMSKRLDQLSKAIEKKVNCEIAVLNLMHSLSDEGAEVAAFMNVVHVGCKNAANAAASLPKETEQ